MIAAPAADVMQGWNNFSAAELGAAATLTGLLFVAVSINLTRILQFQHLPTRAGEALLELISVLIVASFTLVPGQSMFAYGLEIGVTGVVSWGIHTFALVSTRRSKHQRFILRLLMNQLPPLPFVVCGASLVAGRVHGMYWLIPGVLLSFAAGILGAWVLLVEIQR